MASFDILILAAGESKRMTGIKQLLLIDETTFIELTIQKAIELEPRNIIVVLGAYYERIHPIINKYPISIVENKDWKSGMGGSISCGSNFIENQYKNREGLMILLCDQPGLIQDKLFFDKLITLWRNNPEQIVATNHGDNLGVPVIIPASFVEELKKMKGDKGLRSVLNAGKFKVESVDGLNIGVDIDTDEAYQKFLMNKNK